MVIRIFEIGLEQVVIDVRNGKLGLDARNPHRHELEKYHGSCCILLQGMIDPDGYFRARFHFPVYEVSLYDLFRNGFSHG